MPAESHRNPENPDQQPPASYQLALNLYGLNLVVQPSPDTASSEAELDESKLDIALAYNFVQYCQNSTDASTSPNSKNLDDLASTESSDQPKLTKMIYQFVSDITTQAMAEQDNADVTKNQPPRARVNQTQLMKHLGEYYAQFPASRIGHEDQSRRNARAEYLYDYADRSRIQSKTFPEIAITGQLRDGLADLGLEVASDAAMALLAAYGKRFSTMTSRALPTREDPNHGGIVRNFNIPEED